ncbi:MAG: hypothetical protein ABI171_18710 [Collimonas sp.]|uniref:hypothetical protein n=1 Tax=Collimonas sp. TaxID=1963772 RepID=UPI003265A41A
MSTKSSKANKTSAPRYQFLVGANLATLETDLNRLATDNPGLNLNQVFYVQGTGFVGVLERPVEHTAADEVAVEVEVETIGSRKKSQPQSHKSGK